MAETSAEAEPSATTEPTPSASTDSPPASTDSPPAAVTEESLCPPLVASRRERLGGRSRSLRPGAYSDPDGLAAAIPETVGPWSRTRILSHHEGHAGQMSAGATAIFGQGSAQARVSVSDLVHVCVCAPGDGERIRDLGVTDGSARALELGGWPASATHGRGEEIVRVWVGDCCRATVTAPSEEAALELARGLDLAQLEAACQRSRIPF